MTSGSLQQQPPHIFIFIDYTNAVNNNNNNSSSHALISRNVKIFAVYFENVRVESIWNQFESIEVIGVGVSRTSQITFDS